MFKLAVTSLGLGLLLTSGAQAFDPVTEPTAFAYFKLPIGANSLKARTPSVGVRLDQIRAESGWGGDLRSLTKRRALMNLEMGRHGLRAWTVQGRNVLAAADPLTATSGGGSQTKGPPVPAVLVGVAVAAFVITNAAD